MIQPTELRIGSYVSTVNSSSDIHIPSGLIKKVGGISFFSIDLYDVNEHFAEQEGCIVVHPKDLEPIPLTEELLVKAGFEKSFEWFNYKSLSFGYSLQDKKICHYEDEIEVEYLHTLQNFIFVLYQIELTIDL